MVQAAVQAAYLLQDLALSLIRKDKETLVVPDCIQLLFHPVFTMQAEEPAPVVHLMAVLLVKFG
jgi:hypothetical protein